MCYTRLKTKTFCLGILARVLAWVGKQLHTALDKLNGTWYRFSLYCYVEISKWANQTTGELMPATCVGVPIKQHVPRQETWV